MTGPIDRTPEARARRRREAARRSKVRWGTYRWVGSALRPSWPDPDPEEDHEW